MLITGADVSCKVMADVAIWPGPSKIGRVLWWTEKVNWENGQYGCGNGIKVRQNQTGHHMRWIGECKLTSLRSQYNAEGEAAGGNRGWTRLFEWWNFMMNYGERDNGTHKNGHWTQLAGVGLNWKMWLDERVRARSAVSSQMRLRWMTCVLSYIDFGVFGVLWL